MRIGNDVGNGRYTKVGRRENQVGAARIDDDNTVGAAGVRDDQRIAVRADVIGQRINICGNKIQRSRGVGDGDRRQTVVKIIVRRDNAVGRDKSNLVEICPARNAGAVIAVKVYFADDIMSGRNARERVSSVRASGQSAGHNRLARVGNAVAVHVLHQINFHIRKIGFADIVRAVAVRVIPHRTADGGIDRRRGNVIEEVRIRGRRQSGKVEREPIICWRAARVTGQICFHHDVMSGVQIQQFIITIAVRRDDLHERAGRAGSGRVSVKLQRDIRQTRITISENAALINIIVNVAVDGCRRGGDADGAQSRRHGVAVDVRRVIHRSRVVRRTTLTNDFHRHVIRDGRARDERGRTREVCPN